MLLAAAGRVVRCAPPFCAQPLAPVHVLPSTPGQISRWGLGVLIKPMDDRAAELAELEHAVASLQGKAQQRAAADLRQRRAGLKGEQDAAYLIDFHYGASKHRAVIHDLRLEHAGRVAQIDHLIITRWLDCYVLESKHFHAGIKITEQGEFLRWNDFKRTFEGMESPLEQNQRHIAVLKDVMATLDLPVRLGLTIRPSFHSFVLVSGKARIDRPKTFDTGRVIKVDQIKSAISKDVDEESTLTTLASMAKMVSVDTVRNVAEQLVGMHRPVQWNIPKPSALPPSKSGPAADGPSSLAQAPATSMMDGGPRCKRCGSHDGAILYGKYGYYFKCAGCSENTKIRFQCQPGHKPKLRKAGDHFFRECAECGTSQQYFVNAQKSAIG